MECGYYRPQTKFAKAMFLRLSVSHSVHSGEVCLNACWDTPPGPGTPLEQTPPEIPRDQEPPLCTVHAGRYGQQAGGPILLECILVI